MTELNEDDCEINFLGGKKEILQLEDYTTAAIREFVEETGCIYDPQHIKGLFTEKIPNACVCGNQDVY